MPYGVLYMTDQVLYMTYGVLYMPYRVLVMPYGVIDMPHGMLYILCGVLYSLQCGVPHGLPLGVSCCHIVTPTHLQAFTPTQPYLCFVIFKSLLTQYLQGPPHDPITNCTPVTRLPAFTPELSYFISLSYGLSAEP